jgi:hypothetical protein
MSKVIAEISVSVDGYGAGPNQSMDNPVGEDGERLHEWVFPTASWRGQHGMEGGESGPDDDAAAAFGRGVGAYIMGRNMFGPPRVASGTRAGTAGGARTRPTTSRCSC